MAGACSHKGVTKAVFKKRNDQGLHECEVLGIGAEKEESWYSWQKCEKISGHRDFISISEFCADKLPPGYRDSSLVELIKSVAVLTVRVLVDFTSESRPDGVPFAQNRGSKLRHTGSGWVYEVSQGVGPCPCVQCCGNLMAGGSRWWNVVVFTACHVVYDKTEAERTRVDLFYDHEKSSIETLYGHNVEDNNVIDDVCLLQCATHDGDLVATLMGSIKRYHRLRRDVLQPLSSDLCVLVSHPHAQPKKISVGAIFRKTDSDPEASMLSEYMFTYTAATCKGSSGAPVIASVSNIPPWSTRLWPGAGPHCRGHVDKDLTLNQCGPGSFYVKTELLNSTAHGDRQEMLTAQADISFLLIGKTILKQKMFLQDSHVGFGTRERIKMTESISAAISKYQGGLLEAHVVDMAGLRYTSMSVDDGTRKNFLMEMKLAMSVTRGKYCVFIFVLHPDFISDDLFIACLLKNVFGANFVRQNCILMVSENQFGFDKDSMHPALNRSWRCVRGFEELLEDCEGRILPFDAEVDDDVLLETQIEKLLKMVNVLRGREDNYMDRSFLSRELAKEEFPLD